MQPSGSEWTLLYKGLMESTGVDFNEYRQGQLQRRILSFAGQMGCRSLGEFWDFLKADRERIPILLDKLAINVTELFRNPEKWKDMEDKVLPHLVQESPRLKVWSAGCSYGAEAATLAMILHRRFSGAHRILGTDIDESALKQAREGRFSPQDVRAVPMEYARAYLKRQDDSSYLLGPEPKAMLSFKRHNLLRDSFETGFDLILCRNVVIYFSDEAKDALYRRFFSSLRPGGVLFVGSTERVFQGREIGFETPWPFYYQKPKTQREQTWRRAS